MKTHLAYMATALAMASQGMDVRDLTMPHYEKPKPRKCDQKKCKSCQHFDKKRLEQRTYVCKAGKSCYNPLQVACEAHKKRK